MKWPVNISPCYWSPPTETSFRLSIIRRSQPQPSLIHQSRTSPHPLTIAIPLSVRLFAAHPQHRPSSRLPSIHRTPNNISFVRFDRLGKALLRRLFNSATSSLSPPHPSWPSQTLSPLPHSPDFPGYFVSLSIFNNLLLLLVKILVAFIFNCISALRGNCVLYKFRLDSAIFLKHVIDFFDISHKSSFQYYFVRVFRTNSFLIQTCLVWTVSLNFYRKKSVS